MPRNVKIASCSVESDFTKSQRDQSHRLVDHAGDLGADIVCLPEFAAADVGSPGVFLPSSIPGPVTDAFADLARRHEMYIVLPMIEDAGAAAHKGDGQP